MRHPKWATMRLDDDRLSTRCRSAVVRVTTGLLMAVMILAPGRSEGAENHTLIDKLPSDNPAVVDSVMARLAAGAPQSIDELISMMRSAEADQPADTKPARALRQLVDHVCVPGREPARLSVSRALADALDQTGDPAIQRFLVALLHDCGKDEAVDALARALNTPDLLTPASAALAHIGIERGGSALLTAAGRVDLADHRVPLIVALGGMRYAPAYDLVAELATAEDTAPDLRLAALGSLSQIAPGRESHDIERAVEILLGAPSRFDSPENQAKAVEALFNLADQLAEGEHGALAQRVYRKYWSQPDTPANHRWQRAALRGLVAVEGPRFIDDLLAAAESPDEDLRSLALELATTLGDEQLTRRWIQRMRATEPQYASGIARMLGARGDASATPALVEAMRSPAAVLRCAAAEALVELSGIAALDVLLNRLAEDEALRSRIEQLLQEMDDPQLDRRLAAALPHLPPPGAASVLHILTERRAAEHLPAVMQCARSEDAAVRRAAAEALQCLAPGDQIEAVTVLLLHAPTAQDRKVFTDALRCVVSRASDPAQVTTILCRAYTQADPAARATLLPLLAELNTPAARETVAGAITQDDAPVAQTAIHASLANPTDQPVEDMLVVIRLAENPQRRQLIRRTLQAIAESNPSDASAAFAGRVLDEMAGEAAPAASSADQSAADVQPSTEP